MRGLLVKEITILKNNVKTQLFTVALFVAMGLALKNIAYVGMMLTITITNLLIITLSYDEACAWNCYAMTLPVRRESLVTVKYILLYVLSAFSMGITLLLGIPFSMITEISLEECVISTGVCVIMALFSSSLSLLLCFKFGMAKARIMTTVTYMVPFALVFGLYFLNVKMHWIDMNHVTDEMMYWVIGLGLALSLVLSLVFWRVSCHVIRGQDL